MPREDLTQPDTHFAFGRNWAEYAQKVGEPEIGQAVAGLRRLLGDYDLEGRSFIDIGSGSGLHSLAALRLGAARVLAIDIDADSVETTRAILRRFAPRGNWAVERRSVFDLSPDDPGRFDVVYSWGVLHHTGAMKRALQQAATLCNEGGLFVFALYRRVWMDPFWRVAKRWYSRASPAAQRRARSVQIALFRSWLRLQGKDAERYITEYRSCRGMLFEHDVHDWLGGWPYESILPHEVGSLLSPLGFSLERSFISKGRLLGRNSGIFGSGCDEYVYRRIAH
jgi:2-polyprenyl-6-hydroxyphenyl methylase/3-demethylubiquinone-9 3-methyltransferase